MDDATSGIATIIILVVVALIVTQFLKPAPKRDRFLTDLESWVKNHQDKRISQYLEVHIERHFPDFVAWKKSQKNKVLGADGCYVKTRNKGAGCSFCNTISIPGSIESDPIDLFANERTTLYTTVVRKQNLRR